MLDEADQEQALEGKEGGVIVQEDEESVTVFQWPTLETPRPAVEIEQAEPEIAAPRRPWQRPFLQQRFVKRAAMLLSLFLWLSSSLLLWQNVNETHLYLYHIDAATGQTLAQQDLGAYQHITSLTNPILDQSSLLLGVSTQAGQQVLSLAGSGASWNVARQFSASSGRATLSVAPGHLLAIENAGGMQVFTGDGSVLWQVAEDAPSLGAHAFAPAFDTTTAYTIKSARGGIVAAYNLQNGAPRWTQRLDDTLNYAPPLLVAGEIVYVAGDHTVYALNRATGSLLWKADAPSRTLLFDQGSHPELIAVSASGLTAFDANTGAIDWTFHGQPPRSTGGSGDTLTPAQFYQAAMLPATHTLYATGIVWDTQQARQQTWLFAVDASTGALRWSQQVGTGFTSADAARIYTPFVDAAQGLVLVEQARADGSHSLSAFNAASGSQRWSKRFIAVSSSSPGLIQVANNNVSIFSAQTGAGMALRDGSLTPLLLILTIASLLALLLLWVLPARTWLSKMGGRLRLLPHYVMQPLKWLAHLWRFSRLLFALTTVAALISAGILTYTQMNRQQPYIEQVKGSNGATDWQHAVSVPTTLAGVDTGGALIVSSVGDHTFQLSALDSNGSRRWTLPSGEGTFSFPQIAMPAGTELAALSGPAALAYRYAPADPAYQNPLAHYFALYLLDSKTGRVLWQSVITRAGVSQDASVLGADPAFIYIATRSLQGNHVTQLMALDRASGTIAWRYFGPQEVAGPAPDYGALQAHGNFVYWQVENTVYALNTLSGQIEWREVIAEAHQNFAVLEEGQMTISNGVLVVRRSDLYHALDLMTGVEHWTVTGPGVDNPHTPGGIVATGHEIIFYGSGAIEAYDVTTHSILWQHADLVAVSDVAISPDGSLVYAVVFNNLDGGSNEQALIAFDVKTNLVHWTFQPDAQAQLIYAGSRIIYNARGMIYLATCLPGNAGTCSRQVLYGLNAQTGAVSWKLAGRQIYHIQLSQNGNSIIFQLNSSAWEDVKDIFKG